MKISKKIFTASLVVLTFLFSVKSYAHGDMRSQIEEKMGWGLVPQLAYIFDEEGITLELFSDPVKYSVEEAKPVMEEFFKKYPAQQCKITSQGKYADDTRYFTGTYTTTDGRTFNAYFEASLDHDDGHYHLSLIRLEE